MERRTFIQTMGAAAAAGFAPPLRLHGSAHLERVGLELYSVRHEMMKDPDKTLAAVRAAGYSDVELLWSFQNFGRTTDQVVAALKQNGLRAPSAHISPEDIIIGWERRLEIAKQIGHQYLIVPSFSGETSQALDDWRQWADHFNTAGAAARKAGIWLAFHNEPDHMKPIDGKVPYDVFVERLDPTVVRLQLDVGNMVMGGGDPMQYLARWKDRYWAFHLKDVVPDKSSDTELGKGTFDFKKFLAAVPDLNQKPCYVEQEGPSDELAAARDNYNFLHGLEF
ncbi:MAG TPA: sugar phosphate isomerase/epimerase family protein [Gemmatimonadales bacterium]|nr:sugar phosphate isomerase/epimerase family protein [Gemmatimonadales bacterium]